MMGRFVKTEGTLFDYLESSSRSFLESVQDRYRLTYQEIRQVSEIARDLEMWRGLTLQEAWDGAEREVDQNLGLQDRKKLILRGVYRQMERLRNEPKEYGPAKTAVKPVRKKLTVSNIASDKKIHGDCPVASPETVCCNLKTIDAVENCAFACSYCTIQTFYGNEAVFDTGFRDKLNKIEIDPKRFYHFGTGQSSDSLVWGNKEGILEDLCGFARRHPNILLEFKTKSDQVSYFLENEIPANVVCSWSLNTDAVIENEEHFTASLDRRLRAARKAADKGIKVAFHFHPMVYYQGWDGDYSDLARRVLAGFHADEVLFISMGSVTFIKPVMQQIRKRGEPSKILQMELVPAPKGKFSYPDEIKIKQFRMMHQAFRRWHDKVFMYLCMERAGIWDAVWGGHYPTNDAFERDFGQQTMRKL